MDALYPAMVESHRPAVWKAVPTNVLFTGYFSQEIILEPINTRDGVQLVIQLEGEDEIRKPARLDGCHYYDFNDQQLHLLVDARDRLQITFDKDCDLHSNAAASEIFIGACEGDEFFLQFNWLLSSTRYRRPMTRDLRKIANRVFDELTAPCNPKRLIDWQAQQADLLKDLPK